MEVGWSKLSYLHSSLINQMTILLALSKDRGNKFMTFHNSITSFIGSASASELSGIFISIAKLQFLDMCLLNHVVNGCNMYNSFALYV